MNKTVNTVIFMLLATLVNLILIAVIFVALFLFFTLILDENTGPQVATVIWGVIILLSIGGGFFLYNRLIRWVNEKWNLEKYILTSFRRPKR